MTDALGKEIVIGKSYGYIIEKGGIVGVRIGTVLNFTPKSLVTLLVKRVRTQYGPTGEIMDKIELDGFKKTSVRPIKLFPL